GRYQHPLLVTAPHSVDRVLSLQVVPYGEKQRLVLSRDVTQFRQVERMRREFVANVSHELRTPLTVVAGFLETLRDERDGQAARHYIDLMSEQSARMLRLVEDLLTLSALESSPPPPMEEPIAMRKLLDRLGAEARALSNGRHRIEVDGEEGIGIAPEHIPRLTERFYRIDRGRSRETGGTGLGLAIVKHALSRHGAALDIASRPGEGSRFSARFAGP